MTLTYDQLCELIDNQNKILDVLVAIRDMYDLKDRLRSEIEGLPESFETARKKLLVDSIEDLFEQLAKAAIKTIRGGE